MISEFVADKMVEDSEGLGVVTYYGQADTDMDEGQLRMLVRIAFKDASRNRQEFMSYLNSPITRSASVW